MQANWFKKTDFLQTLFDTIPAFLFIVDEDMRINHLNKAALKLSDGNEKSALGKRGGDFLHCIYSFETPEGCGHSSHCKDCVVRRSVGRAFRGEDVYRETTRMNLLSGGNLNELFVSVTASPFRYEGEQLALLVIEDITEQKRYEEALRQHSVRLEASYRDMESFSYSVSHDLRAPLRAILGFSHILLEDHGDKFDGEVKGLVGRISKNAEKMEQLLRDLLEFSRITAQGVKRHEGKIDVEVLVEEVFAELNAGPGERKVDLVMKPLPPAMGDLPMLRQVVVNLLSNALKYTGRVETAQIEVGGSEESGETIYYVKDNGVGFDMRYSDRLYALFSRLHRHDEFEGTGIGLAIVKRIIEKHGGRVWAESKPNEGATFYFALPNSQLPPPKGISCPQSVRKCRQK